MPPSRSVRIFSPVFPTPASRSTAGRGGGAERACGRRPFMARFRWSLRASKSDRLLAVVGVRSEDDSGGGQTTDPDRLCTSETLPFFLRGANANGADATGDRLGCLLVHGFTGTPQEMRFLGECLHRDGYTVSGVRLAGHCTSVKDLARTKWQDWYGSARSGVEELQQHTPQVV